MSVCKTCGGASLHFGWCERITSLETELAEAKESMGKNKWQLHQHRTNAEACAAKYVAEAVELRTDLTAALKERDEALDLLERTEDHADAMLEVLRGRMTEDEIRDYAYQFCGLTAELTPWYENLARQQENANAD